MILKYPGKHAPVLFALIGSLLLLGGCVTAPVPPKPTAPAAPMSPAAQPAPVAPPAPVVAAKPATLTGSEESSTMFDNLTAYVAAVDGHLIAAGRQGWNTPVSLPAGLRRLTVEFNRGVFTARTELQLTARPGAAYQLKFSTDAELFGRNSYCEFWIVDAGSGRNATVPIRVPLTKIAKPQ